MRLTIPRFLILAALAACFLPSVSSAQIGFCSDDFCAYLPPEHPCICPSCPSSPPVQCNLRLTCPLAEGVAATDSKESLTVLDPASAEEAARLGEAELTSYREEEPQSSKAPQPLQTEEGEAR